MLLLLRLCRPVRGSLIATIVAVAVEIVLALLVATVVVVVVAAVPALSWLVMLLLLHDCTTVVPLLGLCWWLRAQPLGEQILRVALNNVSERSGALLLLQLLVKRLDAERRGRRGV